MLLDVWEWFLLISDGVDLVFSSLASGTTLPFSFIVAAILFGLVSFFAWRSTDIPDLPSAPRPPYVIQITAGPGTGGSRQTIADVRLLSGGTFFDGNEILSRYQNLSRNQGTNTDQGRPGSFGSIPSGQIRTTRGATVDSAGLNTRRRIPGRSFLLGLFRRPNSFIRPVPSVSNAIRAQLHTPNVVVYHRVNVYHHHIHSHQDHNNSAIGNSSNTNSGGNTNSDTPVVVDNLNQTLSQSNVPQPPGAEQVGESTLPTTLNTNTSISENEINQEDQAGLPSHDERVRQCRSLSETVAESRAESVNSSDDTSVNCSVTSETVHIAEAVVADSQTNVNPVSVTATSFPNMPASSTASVGDQTDSRAGPSPSPKATTEKIASSDGDDVRFIIKFLNDTQMDVTSHLGERIVDFKRRHFATEMSENKTVRLIFNGRVLDNDNKTLREFGIFDQCVVHCLIVNRQQNQDQTRSGSATGSTGRTNGGQGDTTPGNARRVVGLPEPGMFFVAFIGIFLVFLWFICLHFGQHLFTQSAVVSLTVLTAIFLIGIVACYLPLPTN